MRRALIAAALLTACTDEPASGPAVNSHVEYYEWPGRTAPTLDVLIVVDDTAPMAQYQSALAAMPESAAAALDVGGAQADLRIFATTTAGDGTLRQPASTPATEPYLAVTYDAHFARLTNFTGTFADRLRELLAVGAARDGAVEPLEAARAALTAHADLLRSRSAVGVVTIAASDDASPSPVEDYVAPLQALADDRSRVVVSGFYAMPATRLDAFHASFPNRGWAEDLATSDFGEGLGLAPTILRDLVGDPCIPEPADVDPATLGPQYDCDLRAYYDDGTTAAVRQCAPDFTGVCFELVDDPQYCFDGTMHLVLHGLPNRYAPPIRGQCVVPGA